MAKNTFKILAAASIAAFSYVNAIAGPTQTKDVSVGVDPRIELVSVIFRLAGNEEYNRGALVKYDQDVKNYFTPFKDHPAIKFAAELAKTNDIGFDAPISLAINLSTDFSPRKDIHFPQDLVSIDKRWTPENAKKFTALMGKFAKDTSFKTFFTKHRQLYKTAEERLQSMLDNDVRLTWFPQFFESKGNLNFNAIPGMLTGGNSYGPSITTLEGNRHIYSITAIYADEKGLPAFSPQMRQVIAHEFIHSYTNPLVDKYASELEDSGKKLFSLTSAQMSRQNYGNWKTLMYESLNRACGIRYISATQGADAAATLAVKESDRGFYWVPGLAELLGKYDTQPRKYKDLAEFSPEIIGYFNGYAAKAAEEIQKITDKKLAEKETRNREMQGWRDIGPKIVSIIPADGKKDVTPGKTILTVTFDRPMGSGYSIVTIGPGKCPKNTGGQGFDKAGTTFSMQTELQPATDYSFGLNTADYTGFRSADGTPLYPVEVHFRTAKQ